MIALAAGEAAHNFAARQLQQVLVKRLQDVQGACRALPCYGKLADGCYCKAAYTRGDVLHALYARELQHVSTGRKKEGMLFFGMESAAALIVSLFINVCVVSVFAKGFYGKGIEDIGLENAGNFLGDTFGASMVRRLLFRLFSHRLVHSMSPSNSC